MGSTSSSANVPQDTKAFVDSEIANQKIVVFSKSYCPFCIKAKRALHSAGAKDIMVVHELDHMQNGSLIQDYLTELTGRRTVPNVFVASNNIGGGDETAALHSNGQLAGMVTKAKAK